MTRVWSLRTSRVFVMSTLALLLGFTNRVVAQGRPGAAVPPLQVDAPIERSVTRAMTLSIPVVIGAQQFVRIEIDVAGVEATARLYSGAGRIVGRTAKISAFSDTPLFVSAAAGGRHRLAITVRNVRTTPGTLRVRLVERREATPQDAIRVSAQRAFVRAADALRAASPDLEAAQRDFESAAAQWSETAETRWAARAWLSLSAVHDQADDVDAALAAAQRSRELSDTVGDTRGAAAALNEIGWYHHERSEESQALEAQSEALRLWQPTGERYGEAVTEYHLGSYYDATDNADEALRHYDLALRYFAGTGDIAGQSTTYDYLGHHYLQFGDRQKAVDNFTEALRFARLQGDTRSEAYTRQSLGTTYNALGEYELARDQFAAALRQARQVADRSLESHALLNLGSTFTDLRMPQRAAANLQRARALLQAAGDRRGEAAALNNLARLYRDLGRHADARASVEQAYEIFRALRYSRGELISLTGLGRSLCDEGRFDECFGRLQDALTLSRALNDRSQEATILSWIARFTANRGNLPEALTRIGEAERLVEALRPQIARDDLRASAFAVARPVLERKVEILMRLHATDPSRGWDAAAFDTSERARARSMLDVLPGLRASAESHVPPSLLARRQQVVQRLRDSGAEGSVEAADLQAQYYDVQAQIRHGAPRYAELAEAKAISLMDASNAIGPGAVALEYLLGEERGYLWAVTDGGLRVVELPARARVEASAHDVLKALRAWQQDPLPGSRAVDPVALNTAYWRAADALSAMVLRPVSDAIKGRRVYIVADGALQTIPFAALPLEPAGRNAAAPHPLIATNEVVVLPSLSLLTSLPRRDRSFSIDRIAVVADPVYESNDGRLSSIGIRSAALTSATATAASSANLALATQRVRGTQGRLPRLSGAAAEASAISRLAGGKAVSRFEGLAASRQLVTGGELARYDVVHFATHGLLNNQRPELSGLVLSLYDEHGQPADGFLRLVDVYALKLSANLVVLSACESARGKEVAGEGVIGLTRGFLLAGADQVLSSLWTVNDLATTELMTAFYASLLRDGRSPAAALQQAQLHMLKTARWSAPYLWGAFALYGD